MRVTSDSLPLYCTPFPRLIESYVVTGLPPSNFDATQVLYWLRAGSRGFSATDNGLKISRRNFPVVPFSHSRADICIFKIGLVNGPSEPLSLL